MALTLIEAMKVAATEGKTIKAGVIAQFARASAWLAAIPFKDIQGNAYAYNLEGTLPGVAFRGINESFTPSTGIINQAVEALRIAGGELDVDTFLVKTGGPNVRNTHETMKIKALAASLSSKLIKGDSTSDPREFDGLQKRITGSQLIAAGTTDNGDALSLAKLDELIDAVAGPNKVLLMNKALRRRLSVAARTTTVGGNILYTQDEFGRQLMKYNDIPILVEYPENDGTETLAFDEQGDVGGTPGGSTSTSIYCVSFADGYVAGLQNGGMDVRDLGELQSSPVYRTRVEWFAGMCVENGKGAARLGGVANAAVVA
jgi:hypothetical protein